MGASQPRNERLAALFYRLRLIEAYGAGISKIISSYKNTRVESVFENVEGAFRVILPNVNTETNLINISDLSIEDEKYIPILNLFNQQKEFTRKDVEDIMGIGSTHAINTIKEMIEKNLIKKVGKGRKTRYIKK